MFISRAGVQAEEPQGFAHGFERAKVATRANDAVVLGCLAQNDETLKSLSQKPLAQELNEKGTV